jgi:predicted Zn-ribbon and HTH transcriptional regulator
MSNIYMTGHTINMTALGVAPVSLSGIVRHIKQAGLTLPKGKIMAQARCKECGYMIAPIRPNRKEYVCRNEKCSLVALLIFMGKGN